MKARIVVILPRGETFRNFVYTGFLKELEKSYEVHILAVYPNDELANSIKNQVSSVNELQSGRYGYFFALYQDIFDLVHNRLLWSEAARVRWEMRDVEAKGVRAKIYHSLKKIVAIMLAGEKRIQILGHLNQKFAEREYWVKYWMRYLNEVKPILVFNTSHSHAANAHPVVYAANALQIKTCAFLFSWDNLTSQGRIIPDYRYYFAWNSQIKADLLRIYPRVDGNNVYVTGTPQFVGHFRDDEHLGKDTLKSKLGLKNDEEYFLYSSGMSHHLPHEPYVVERIADKIKEIGPQYRLVVRTYAKDRYDVFDSLKQRRPDIIIPDVLWEKNYQTPLEDDQIFFSSLLKHCIAGMNVASTVSLELCIFDKPTINIGYNPPGKDIYPYNYTRFYYFDHYKPIVDSGAVEVASNENELAYLLNEAIINPGKNSEKRKALINNFFEGLHGTNVIFKFKSSINEILLKF